MKNNTRKLLLFLYPNTKERLALPVESLELICSELTASGRQSLLRLLEKRGWILSLLQPNGSLLISLTSLGKAALEREFPVLFTKISKDSEIWTAILFCVSSKSDPQFRNLRRMILSNGGLALTRGMYVFSGSLPIRLQTTISSLYGQQVSIFTISEWIFGKDPSLLFDKSGLARVVEIYSSISKEVDELLSILYSEKGLNNKRKQQISTVLERAYRNVLEDSAMVHRFYPDAVPMVTILQKIQSLILTMFQT